MAVAMAIINSGSSIKSEAMHLRRCLAFLEAKWGIQLWAKHVKGEDQLADIIPRNRVDKVFALHPQIAERPEKMDTEVLQVLVHNRQAGRNPNWSRQWRCCSRKA